jgi:hypothetical protein
MPFLFSEIVMSKESISYPFCSKHRNLFIHFIFTKKNRRRSVKFNSKSRQKTCTAGSCRAHRKKGKISPSKNDNKCVEFDRLEGRDGLSIFPTLYTRFSHPVLLSFFMKGPYYTPLAVHCEDNIVPGESSLEQVMAYSENSVC